MRTFVRKKVLSYNTRNLLKSVYYLHYRIEHELPDEYFELTVLFICKNNHINTTTGVKRSRYNLSNHWRIKGKGKMYLHIDVVYPHDYPTTLNVDDDAHVFEAYLTPTKELCTKINS
jgi:hypothetical protein